MLIINKSYLSIVVVVFVIVFRIIFYLSVCHFFLFLSPFISHQISSVLQIERSASFALVIE